LDRANLVFDRLSPIYDAWFEEQGKLIFAIEISAFGKVLPSLPKNWLEVGVGTGRFAQALKIETGIDPSVNMLGLARKRGISVLLARGENECFKNESFGTVFLIVTLCFVDSPLDVLYEANRVLKADGKLVLGLVLRDSPWGQFYLSKKQEGHRFYQHATFYSFEELSEFLEATGFVVENLVSTLFQRPGEVAGLEAPQNGFSVDSGFTVVVAGKVASGRRGYLA
jgi:SAM-dependent methyltransferase